MAITFTPTAAKNETVIKRLPFHGDLRYEDAVVLGGEILITTCNVQVQAVGAGCVIVRAEYWEILLEKPRLDIALRIRDIGRRRSDNITRGTETIGRLKDGLSSTQDAKGDTGVAAR